MKTRFLSLLLGCLLVSACSSHEQPATPPPVVETGVDPQAWALIPAGPFLMGRHADEMVVDYDYRIMVTDVTTGQYANYLNEALGSGMIEIEGSEVRGYYPGDEFHGHEHEERIEAGQWLHLPLEAEGQSAPRSPAPVGGPHEEGTVVRDAEGSIFNSMASCFQSSRVLKPIR